MKIDWMSIAIGAALAFAYLKLTDQKTQSESSYVPISLDSVFDTNETRNNGVNTAS